MKIFIISAAFAVLASAQATRTWVSGVGDDANPCSRTAPCKTFAGAISKTAAGGEISTLDPGGFGGVTITKAITLNGDGNLASILVSGTAGITVNAGVNDVVLIRGISFAGIGSGTNGINFVAGNTLIVEDCSIYGFLQSGIAMAGPGNLIVRSTKITGLPGVSTSVGVTVGPTGPVTANLSNVSIRNVVTGVDAKAGVTDISNSVISLSSSYGVLAENGATLSIENSVLTNSGTAVQANVGGTVRVSGNNIHDNAAGFGCGGTIASAGNNPKAGDAGTQPSCPPNATITFK
jgi:hypothetical protein